jgi:hypothetical protein
MHVVACSVHFAPAQQSRPLIPHVGAAPPRPASDRLPATPPAFALPAALFGAPPRGSSTPEPALPALPAVFCGCETEASLFRDTSSPGCGVPSGSENRSRSSAAHEANAATVKQTRAIEAREARERVRAARARDPASSMLAAYHFGTRADTAARIFLTQERITRASQLQSPRAYPASGVPLVPLSPPPPPASATSMHVLFAALQ